MCARNGHARGRLWGSALLMGMLALGLLLAGCGSGEGSASPLQPGTLEAPALSMDFPTSLTGAASASGGMSVSAPLALSEPMSGGDPVCKFGGQDESDPLRNGYVMTRWLVANAAGWLCFTDFLSHITTILVNAHAVPTDGTVVALTPSKPGDPTGLSVTVAGAQVTLRLYFLGHAQPGLFLSWVRSGGTTSGRLVVLAALVQNDPLVDLTVDAEAPTHARMDFAFGPVEKRASMSMAFDPYGEFNGTTWTWYNPWATGFRVDVMKTLATGRYDIRGIITTKDQFFTLYPGVQTPVLKLAAVSNAAGSGASVASMLDVAVAFDLGGGEALGYLLFDKEDRYYFDAAGLSEWIRKDATAAQWIGGLSHPSTPAATIDGWLTPMPAGTTAACEGSSGPSTDCVTLLNAIFDTGWFGMDLNDSGLEPADWRQTALNAAVAGYLTEATPDGYGDDWTGVFGMSYTP